MGAPGVISWTHSGSSRMYISDENQNIVQSVRSGVTSIIESRLTFLRHPYLRDTGERTCMIASTYVSANSSETNTSTITGNHSLDK